MATDKENLPGLIADFIQKTPKTLKDLVWKIAATSTLLIAGLSALALWRHPELLKAGDTVGGRMILERRDLTHVIEAGGSEENVTQLLSAFINRYGPTKVALSARTDVGISELIWANQSTLEWPLSVDGLMGSTMAPILGYLVLGECWTGEFIKYDPLEYWVVCGLTDKQRHWGSLFMTFKQPQEEEIHREVRILAQRLTELILGSKN